MQLQGFIHFHFSKDTWL